MVLQSFFQSGGHALGVELSSTAAQVATAGLLLLSVGLTWVFCVAGRKDTPAGTRKIHMLPSTLPLLGNTLDFMKNITRRHDWFADLAEHYGGEPYMLKLFGRPGVVYLSTVEGFEEVLKNKFSNFPKGEFQTGILHDILGDGIFGVDGAKWVHQRKTASNLFTTRAIRDNMADVVRRHTVTLRELFEKAGDEDRTLDFFKLINRFTIEAFAEIGFGIKMNGLETEEDHPFQAAFDSAQRVVVSRYQRPMWLWKLQRALNIGKEAQLKQDLNVINTTVFDIIAQALANRNNPDRAGERGTDIVSLFLDRFDSSAEDAGQSFDPIYLRDIVVNFLVAGRDTTAQALSWFFLNLHQNPHVVQKLREEMARELPGLFDGSIETPSLEQVQKLTFLEATLKETLRLHPSVPISPKHVVKDIVLSDGTFLRAGSLVALPFFALGRMPHVWGPDARKFNPERWIDPSTGKIITVSASKFVAFNAGPRLCLGMNLALMEMKIVTASILSRVDLELVPGQNTTYDNSLTLPVRGQMMIRVKKYEA